MLYDFVFIISYLAISTNIFPSRFRWWLNAPSPKSRSREFAELVRPKKCNALSPAQR